MLIFWIDFRSLLSSGRFVVVLLFGILMRFCFVFDLGRLLVAVDGVDCMSLICDFAKVSESSLKLISRSKKAISFCGLALTIFAWCTARMVIDLSTRLIPSLSALTAAMLSTGTYYSLAASF